MGDTRTVGVKELKNKLSAYLREVRAGNRLLVSDRDTVVAEMHEPCPNVPLTASINPTLAAWAKSRTVRLPLAEKQKLEPSPVRKSAGTSIRLLDQDRGDVSL